MILRLLAAFIIVPLVELFLLLQLSHATSVPTTLAIVIVTGIIGTFLARHEGIMAWFRFQSALAEGRVPSREIQDGLMIVFAAALLLTPGLITDALGFALLIPPARELIRQFVLSRMIRGLNVTVVGNPAAGEAGMGGEADASYTIDAKAVHRSP